jgi:hypothetical protein
MGISAKPVSLTASPVWDSNTSASFAMTLTCGGYTRANSSHAGVPGGLL